MPAKAKSRLNRNSGRKNGHSDELRIEYMPLGKLVKWPRNPKGHLTEKINSSMERFGYNDPIAIDESTQRVVEGHGRIDALQQRRVLGLDPPARVTVKDKEWYVPVLRGIDFKNAKEAEAYLLSHNQLVVAGGYDDELLTDMFANLDKDLFDITGFDESLYKDLTKTISNEEIPQAVNGEAQGEQSEDTIPAEDRFSIYSMDYVADQALKYFREVGLPFGTMPLHEQMQEINLLSVVADASAINTVRANRVADCYHPWRAACKAAGAKHSLVEGFNSDRNLLYAIKMEFFCGSMVKTDYPSLLQVVHNTQVPANFRPGAAMFLYRRYGKANGLILDPCAGWGGRLVGWIASKLGGAYCGVDPSPDSYKGNSALKAALAPDADVRLYNEAFEDLELEEHKLVGAADLVFTSPPYFNKELYEGEKQAFRRYPKFTDWTERFLRPLLFKSYEALKPGGVCALNIGDTRDLKGKIYPLELLTIQYATMAGFTQEETLYLSISTNKFGSIKNNLTSLLDDSGISDEAMKEKQIEPVLIFRKS